MGRSKETSNKKEVRTKQAKKRKEKEKRRLEKKTSGGKASFDSMLAYVDENGVISSTPPDLTKKDEVIAENIEVSVPKSEGKSANDRIRTGKVLNYNDSKGYGFINDSQSNDSIFVHCNDCNAEIKNNDLVEFEVEKSAKGLKAVNVKVLTK